MRGRILEAGENFGNQFSCYVTLQSPGETVCLGVLTTGFSIAYKRQVGQVIKGPVG